MRDRHFLCWIATPIFAVLFLGCSDPSDDAWEVASASENPEVLREFLADYPDSKHRNSAEGLLFDAMWRGAVAADTASAWEKLVDDFPEHQRADEARRMLYHRFVAQAWRRADEELINAAGIDETEFLAIAISGLMPTAATPNSMDAILDLVALVVREAGPDRAYGLRSVEPLAGPWPGGWVSGPLEEPLPLASVDSARIGRSGRVTIVGSDSEAVLLATELPSESVFVEMVDLGIPKGFRLWAGHGTRYRIKGHVEGLFPGLTIVGDYDAPLVLGLWDHFGLVYLSGKGKVTLGDTHLEFPSASRLQALVSRSDERTDTTSATSIQALKPFFGPIASGSGRNKVAMSEGWVFIAAPRAAGGGRILVYREHEGHWFEHSELKPANGRSENFGEMIDADQGIAAASNGDVIEIFELQDKEWIAVAAVTSPPPGPGYVGAVSIRSDLLAAGDPVNGAVHVYRRGATGWEKDAELRAPGAVRPGQSIAVGDDHVLVGAEGSAYLFSTTDDGWSIAATFDGGPSGARDGFGSAVALIQDKVAVSTRFHGNSPDAMPPDGKGSVSIYAPGTKKGYSLERIVQPDPASPLVGFGAELAVYKSNLVVAALGSGFTPLYDAPDLDQAVLLVALDNSKDAPRTVFPQGGGTTASLDDVDATDKFVVVAGAGEAWAIRP